MKAFQHWSDASSLNFQPTGSQNADLKLSFAAGRHDDNFPFDGKGGVLAHVII